MSTLEIAPETTWFPQPSAALPSVASEFELMEYVYLVILGGSIVLFLFSSKFQS